MLEAIAMFQYDSDHQSQISFPIGGIGSGSVGLAGNGRLIDWSIYNRPDINSEGGYSHFAVKCERDGKLLDARVLNADLQPPYQGSLTIGKWDGAFGFGTPKETLAGIPHFESVEFTGKYPIAELAFRDSTFPGEASLTAFNPLIPLDAKNSSLPAAFFEIEIKNTNAFDADYTVAFSVGNRFDCAKFDGKLMSLTSTNDKNSVEYGDLAFATDHHDISHQESWFRGMWFDALTTFWNEFTGSPRLANRSYDAPKLGGTSTIAAHARVKAGGSQRFRFVLAWNIPNCENYWNRSDERPGTWKNYYATVFSDSSETVRYCLANWDDLYGRTTRFLDALLGSSLPEAALEPIVSNLALMKSPTVLRLEDGELYGFEGVARNVSVCEGSCTHVWNYAYAFPFLFPELERSMRSLDYKHNLRPDGGMPFRLQLPVGSGYSSFRPCADGQFGGVIKTYRDWKISGDDDWLRSVWPAVKASLEFAWSPENEDRWDLDKDGVLEGRQHHTLDMELFGPNSWLTGFYLGALKAGSEMAEYLGERDKSAEYAALFERGSKWVEENLFNGEWYHQKIDLRDFSVLEPHLNAKIKAFGGTTTREAYWNEENNEIKYQIAEGCEVQQVMAQWHANICGLGQIFDKGRVRTALSSLFKHNFKRSMRRFANPCRNYCLNDEAGLVIATWPEGVRRPTIPLPYESETQNGYEYQALIHMIQEGLVDEGLEGVKAIRDRYDGRKRNPWSEIECGSYYARSMASYALMLAFSGFKFDMTRGHIGFAPVRWDGMPDTLRYFWSLDCAWGIVEIEGGKAALSVVEGSITLRSFELYDTRVEFGEPLTIGAGMMCGVMGR